MGQVLSNMYIGLHVKCPLFLSDFNVTLIFSTNFREMLISSFMKLRLVRAELLHADKQANRTTDGQT